MNLNSKRTNFNSVSSNNQTDSQLNYHKQNLKELWGKSISEIYAVLFDPEKIRFELFKHMRWRNSNILLAKDVKYQGIKTGGTTNAKFCLASFKNEKKFKFLTGTNNTPLTYYGLILYLCCEPYDKELYRSVILTSFIIKDSQNIIERLISGYSFDK